MLTVSCNCLIFSRCDGVFISDSFLSFCFSLQNLQDLIKIVAENALLSHKFVT